MYKRAIPLLSQDDIGFELGLTVPPEFEAMLPTARVANEPPTTAGFGTQIQTAGHTLNEFFARRGIPLRETFVGASDLPDDLVHWFGERLADADLVACFNYRALYGVGNDGGHMSVVESASDAGVVLIDPGPNQPKQRLVLAADLLGAIRHHGNANYGGILVIEPV